MGNHFFLTGKPRVGKTTVLKKIINALGIENFGGFYTEEIVENSNRTGFKIISLDGEESVIADINSKSDIRVGRYGVNVSEFESIAIQSIQNNAKKIIVIDEIGPMQIASPKFLSTINQFMQGPQTVLGTIYYDSHPKIDEIKANSEMKIYELTQKNYNDVLTKMIYELRKTSLFQPK
ncbi:nucleoside-triphosphatase [Bacillus sp. AFS018417]|uniref:nucleoside-triphosphatase n=1 Tax=unclassified Bacillus (in: firmicutes) TaxID=185979 RepID=UPI001596E07E|nr:nucleoside-triphosphatase [Bacillus sp. AFS018417]